LVAAKRPRCGLSVELLFFLLFSRLIGFVNNPG
jgi:hypothetical protein